MSATSLFYEYLITHQHLQRTYAISAFVELVRQYDTWEWEKNDNQKAKRLNSLFYLVSIEEFEEKMIQRLRANDDFHVDDFEKKILDMEDSKIERYIRRKRRQLIQTKVNEHFAGVVHAESYHSELGNELGKEYPHLDYIVILNMGGKRAGFRTIQDRKSTRLNSSHVAISYAVFCLKKKNNAQKKDSPWMVELPQVNKEEDGVKLSTGTKQSVCAQA